MTGVDFSELEALHKALRGLPDTTRKALRPVLREVGNPILAAAKANASWSTRIGPSLTLSVRFSGSRPGIGIRARASIAPHARAFEGLLTDEFRHPLFGNRDWWYAQAARPFIYPAMERGADAARDEIEKAVAAALASLAADDPWALPALT